MNDTTNTSKIKKWLTVCCFMVIAMVLVGGLTRLEHAGLSITEWKPITGIIPPLNAETWQLEFTKYQASPEYRQHNYGMSLSDFKFIFYLEFIHRILGRLTVLVYLIPLLYFYYSKERLANIKAHIIVAFLFFLQGFMGWYMVESGLGNLPYVSHFRLATHLTLAIVIYNLLFWQLLYYKNQMILMPSIIKTDSTKKALLLAIIALYLQIIIGALVAGLNAGLLYNTFPLMGNSFIPPEVVEHLADFNDPGFIQFLHRIMAYIVSFLVIIAAALLRRLESNYLTKVSWLLILALSAQMLLGIVTILYHRPIIIALLHQLGAIFLLTCLIKNYFLLKNAYCN